MTDYENTKLQLIVDKEIQEFKEEMLSNDKKQIYDFHYKISAYERIYSFIVNESSSLDYKGFPEKNILPYFYDKFMDTGYNLDDDMLLFFKEETDFYKKYRQHEIEM